MSNPRPARQWAQHAYTGARGGAVRTQDEVAKILGLTQDEVSKAERAAFRKIFKAMKSEAKAHGYPCVPPNSREGRYVE